MNKVRNKRFFMNVSKIYLLLNILMYDDVKDDVNDIVSTLLYSFIFIL